MFNFKSCAVVGSSNSLLKAASAEHFCRRDALPWAAYDSDGATDSVGR